MYIKRHCKSFPGQWSHYSKKKWCTKSVFKTNDTKDCRVVRLILKFAPDVEAAMIVLPLWHRLNIYFGKSKINLCTHCLLIFLKFALLNKPNRSGYKTKRFPFLNIPWFCFNFLFAQKEIISFTLNILTLKGDRFWWCK